MSDMTDDTTIRVYGARQHNLRNIDVVLPRSALTVITGPSGSGKSSLAFDTIHAEGQRRYVESLSAYARQFLEQLQKPDVDRVEGLSPTIAIEQRGMIAGPRSIVATSTDIYDYLRVLFARVGEPRCWKCDRRIEKQSTAQIVDAILAEPHEQRVLVLAPLIQAQRGVHDKLFERLSREGFVRVRVDGEVQLIEGINGLSSRQPHTIDVVVDRLVTKPEIATRLADSVELATKLSRGRVTISFQSEDKQWRDLRFSTTLTCPLHDDVCIENLSPQLFSFNAPLGACPDCHGLGITLDFDPELVVADPNLSLAGGAVAAWKRQGKRLNEIYQHMIHEFCRRFEVLPDAPYRNIDHEKRRILLEGTTTADEQAHGHSFEGVMPNLKRRWETTDSESAKQRLHAFLAESPCQLCRGARLSQASLAVHLCGKTMVEIISMTIEEALGFFESYKPTGEAAKIAGPLVKDIVHRLRFLVEVGVEYLTLDRSSKTLSGGEWQRIRLATQIGGGLSGVCYVLDEPTIGLHPRDSQRLLVILKNLSSMGNSVIVVEHDEAIIAGADHMIDIGPGAGLRGGNVVAEGSVKQVLATESSLTAKFLTGALSIGLPQQRRVFDHRHCLEIKGITANNLKNIDVAIPLGRLVVVTGVSGSGKSTLVSNVLLRGLRREVFRRGPRPGAYTQLVGASLIDQLVEVDQSPIGKSPRSTPATYVGVFNPIRTLFSQARQAKIRGYGPARFSFNIKGGRCEHCEGQGTKRVSMHFLPDVYVTCGHCQGRRFNRETLDIRFRGKNIADVLDMRVEQAVVFFENFANIRKRIQVLRDVGLGYMSLGQPSSTLSGGEAQRIKLASELHKTSQDHTLYVLDEPTTGLHFSDVRHLLSVLNRLVDQGHSVICVEHDLDVIKMADWVIDLGPGGGAHGGNVVAQGTPEQIVECQESVTGQWLKDRLAGVAPLAELSPCGPSRPR